MLAMRDGSAIGHMDGSWPPCERAQLSAMDLGTEIGVATLSSLVASWGSAFLPSLDIVRVGSHPEDRIERFIRLIMRTDCEAEPGLAGWSWVRPSGRRSAAVSDADSLSELAMAALTLWQQGPDGGYRLPVELCELAMLTTALLSAADVPFLLTFRPRYAPVQVDLQLEERTSPHASVQVVRMVSVPAMLDVELDATGAYLIASGHLVGH
jgi:hypothetical protein